MILNQIDPVLELHPLLSNYYILVHRRGWHGANEAAGADIMLVEDLSTWKETVEEYPDCVLLDVGPADFVDHDYFSPIECEVDIDVLQISCWSRRKRIELFIRAASRLPHLSFMHLGHFENGGARDEVEYRAECLELATSLAPNVAFPFLRCESNKGLPSSKEVINRFINRAKLGLLTSESEGINRFKMECMAADRPFLVACDVMTPTRKHINERTGMLYEPNAVNLSKAIVDMLDRLQSFEPRKYLITNTGKKISLGKLRSALVEVCVRSGEKYRFDNIDWDGRNESLIWGQRALDLIAEKVKEFSALFNTCFRG
ncbi:hypothetical protein QEH53_23120 [Pelagicoccus sp. SDUM812002]|nr:hypothetical protein [Pelagicoccus sp. SDUM812002]